MGLSYQLELDNPTGAARTGRQPSCREAELLPQLTVQCHMPGALWYGLCSAFSLSPWGLPPSYGVDPTIPRFLHA